MEQGFDPLVEMRGITVWFPGVLANDHVDFDLAPGEIHVLLGENGAGKTTLVNVLYGMLAPDAGEIRLRGERVRFGSARDAIEHGIGMVHQHFMLVPTLSVVENVVLGLASEKEPFLLLRRKAQRVEELSERHSLGVKPWSKVGHLSVGEQQKVEILKALYRRAEVLILDEPTAVLAPQEIRDLLATVRALASEGMSIIFITHKLDEVMAAGDRVTVLRDGRVVGVTRPGETTKQVLAAMMVGRPVSFHLDREPVQAGAEVLRLDDLAAQDEQGVMALDGVSLSVRQGEILGIAGVDGNGQAELVEVITGLRRPARGRVLINGDDVTGQPPRSILRQGLAHVPADRRRRGLVVDFSVADNLSMQAIYAPPLSRRGFLNMPAVLEYARNLVAEYDVRAPGVNTLVRQLSGGNQQKVVLARELSRSPALVIAAQPTRGLDVGAMEYVHRRFLAERSRGAAILLVSTELDEILELSDRIAVLFRGRIMGIVDRDQAKVETLGLMMTGVTPQSMQDGL